MTVTPSTELVTDIASLTPSSFTAATLLKAKNAKVDLIGMAEEAALKACELINCLNQINAVLDSGDTQRAVIANILAALV